MRVRTSLFVAVSALCLAGALPMGTLPAAAQDEGGGERRKLDLVLAVLRAHTSAAGKACLQAMSQVHQTEDQVTDLSKETTNPNKTDNGADIARDVLDSDYETADGACRPDAVRACQADPSDRTCMAMNR